MCTRIGTPTHSRLQIRTHLLTHKPHAHRAKSWDGPWSPGTSTGRGHGSPGEPREAPSSLRRVKGQYRALGKDSWVGIPSQWLRHQPPSDTCPLSPSSSGTLGSDRWSCLCRSNGSGCGRAAGFCDYGRPQRRGLPLETGSHRRTALCGAESGAELPLHRQLGREHVELMPGRCII